MKSNMKYTLDGYPMPSTILLASGGVRGFSYIGALEELERRGCLAGLKTWAGVSAGSLTAASLAIGYTLAEMRDVIVRFNFGVLKNINETSPLRLFDTYGLDNGEMMRRFFHALLHVRGLPDTYAFKDLPADRDLKIWVTNLSRGRLECFSRATTPDIPIMFAVQASSTIPVVFDPIRSTDGDLLIDGAVINAFPMHALSPEERADALGIICVSDLSNSHPEDFTDYLKKCLLLGFEYRSHSNIETFRDQVITIDTTDISAIEFEISSADKKRLIDRGAETMRTFLAAARQKRHGRIERRHSWHA